MSKKYKLECSGMYGVAKVSKEDFNKIPDDLFHLTDESNDKYMNANTKEIAYLKKIGCYDDTQDQVFDCVDWFKLVVNNV